MANSRYYSSTAVQTTLTNSITNSTTIIQVGATTGFPGSLPYTLAIDYGSASEELVEVTGVAGLNLTVTRAIDLTSAQSHSAGAIVKHVSSARDFTDSRTHEVTTTAVHGVVGTLVGTTDTQTLTNKTLVTPTINTGGALTGTFSGTHTYSGAVTFSGSLALGSITISGSPTFSGSPVIQGTLNMSGATAIIQSTKGSVAQQTLAALVSGDAFDRYRLYPDGLQEWGPGNLTRDTNLYRSAADTLKTDDALVVTGELRPGNLVRGTRGTATDSQYETRVTGDTNARWYMQADGKMFWGDGTATPDVNLYRNGANSLFTDDTFGSAVTLSTSLTAASGFTLNSAAHRKTGDITTVTGYLQRSGGTLTPTANTTNITDTLLATIPSGFRPPIVITCIWSNGLTAGEALIDTDGTVTLRTTGYNQSISTGDNIRFSATWVA